MIYTSYTLIIGFYVLKPVIFKDEIGIDVFFLRNNCYMVNIENDITKMINFKIKNVKHYVIALEKIYNTTQ